MGVRRTGRRQHGSRWGSGGSARGAVVGRPGVLGAEPGALGGFPARFVLAELVSGAAPGVERAVSPRDRWRRSSPLNGICDGGISVGPGERLRRGRRQARGRPGAGRAPSLSPGAGQGRAGQGGGHRTVHGGPRRRRTGAGAAPRPPSPARSPSVTPPSPHRVPGQLSPSRSFEALSLGADDSHQASEVLKRRSTAAGDFPWSPGGGEAGWLVTRECPAEHQRLPVRADTLLRNLCVPLTGCCGVGVFLVCFFFLSPYVLFTVRAFSSV